MQYPSSITAYFDRNRIDPESTLFMIVSTDGIIIDVGNINQVLINEPSIGSPSENFIFALMGLFPLNQNLYLPNIQLSPIRYFNLHLLVDSGLVWIIVHETSVKVADYTSDFDKYFRNNQTEISILNGLGYFVFTRTVDGKCKICNQTPEWAKDLLPCPISGNLCATEIFPFLEGFASLLPGYYPGVEYVKKYAGIWTQTKPNGNEITLQAWALLNKAEAYMIVCPVEQGLSNEAIIQSAREHSLAYEQLQKAKNHLQELVKLKEQFVNIVSHDYRSPISTLIDGVSCLQEVFQNSQNIGNPELAIIEQVKNELIRLLEYNNKLYNWTQINLETLELNLENVPLKMIFDSAKNHFQTRLREKHIDFRINIFDEGIINADYVLMTQVLFNIIDNAIKFSHENGIIEIEASSKFIKIKDYGVGMPQHLIEEIKNGIVIKSTRGTQGERGTGLGLSIVCRIVDTLNLKLQIASEINKGTIMTVIIP